MEPAGTDLLVTLDGNVLGLSIAANMRTAGLFLPDGAQITPLMGLVNGFVNGSDIPAAYVDPVTNELVTAGVPVSYDGTITVLRLVPAP